MVQVTKGERRSSRLAAIFTVALCVTAAVMLVVNAVLHTEVPTIQHNNRQPLLLPRGSSRAGVTASRRNVTTGSIPIAAATTTTATVDSEQPATPPPLPADGSFQNLPIYYKTEYLHSTYSCVGENFREDAWLFRSCSFRNLCFDMTNRTFVVFQSDDDRAFAQLVQDSNLTHIATVGTHTLSLGGINPKWRGDARKALEWFPQILSEQPPNGYYELPTNTVWVPFHSFAGQNTGHLVWDDFFPIFKLLGMFDLLQNTLFLTKMDLKRWGTCDWNPKNIQKCIRTFQKFLPAMGMTDIPLSTVNSTDHDFKFVVDDERTTKKSNYICAPHGAAGLGMLTDHGLKMHGWDEEDWESTYNAGRGQVFYEFRNFMLRNLGISNTTTITTSTTTATMPLGLHSHPPSYNIVFSRFSSDTAGRVKGFGKQEKLIRQSLWKSHNLTITNHRMSQLSLRDQAEITSQAAIFVTAVGGGAMTATFLPRGASLILFYEAKGGRRGNRETGKPARLDWDLLNHASHLRVHWLPIETCDETNDLHIFLELVKHELQIIKQL